MPPAGKMFITDFDGTMTRRDFYSCAVERLLRPADMAPWERFTRGEITHFEALRTIFSKIRAPREDVLDVARAMDLDPAVGDAVRAIRACGWHLIIVSNGTDWYIRPLLEQAGVRIDLLSNPGEYTPEAGLDIRLPLGSPYLDPAVGIRKAAVVRAALDRGARVAFAGDGRPDVEPAEAVSPELRFARGWLAGHFEERGVPFRRFDRWSEIARALEAESRA